MLHTILNYNYSVLSYSFPLPLLFIPNDGVFFFISKLILVAVRAQSPAKANEWTKCSWWNSCAHNCFDFYYFEHFSISFETSFVSFLMPRIWSNVCLELIPFEIIKSIRFNQKSTFSKFFVLLVWEEKRIRDRKKIMKKQKLQKNKNFEEKKNETFRK